MFKGVNNQKQKEGSRHSKDFSFKHTYKTRLTDFLDFFLSKKTGITKKNNNEIKASLSCTDYNSNQNSLPI